MSTPAWFRAERLDLPISGNAGALRKGEIDACFVVAGPDAPAVRELLKIDGVRLMSLAQAETYTRLFPYLSRIMLPQGAMDLMRNIPDRDTALVTATAILVARDDLHPALMSLLIQAAIEVHNHPGLFQRPGEFPAAIATDFPLSEEASRYFKSGPPFFQRYLPFWFAIFVERIIVLLVPIVVVLIPLMRILPALYSWQVKRRIYRWYGELKYLERDVEQRTEPARTAEYLARLDEIEQRVSKLKVPLAYSDEVYTLRQHIHLVRDRISQSQVSDRVLESQSAFLPNSTQR
ncbi:MAG TPA: hypothetical protein VKF40_00120 [Burkholderiales bacterium]|nr:hypothetical protein [Burkholderiales bacterium]